MTPYVKPKNAGRSGENGPTGSRHEEAWLAIGYEAEDDAIAAVLADPDCAATVTTNAGVTLYRGPIRYEEAFDTDQGGTQFSGWEIQISYGTADRIGSDADKTRLEIDTTGGTAHITQSKSTTDKYPSATAPDFKQAIGVSGEDVEGTDVPVSVFRVTAMKVFDPDDLPDPEDLRVLTGTFNDEEFTLTDDFTDVVLVFDAGECVFMGARLGSARPDGLVEVVYEFDCYPNATGLTIGDVTGIDKIGADFLWVYYETAAVAIGGGGGKVLTQKPKFVYVERVMDPGDFALLGVGEVAP